MSIISLLYIDIFSICSFSRSVVVTSESCSAVEHYLFVVRRLQRARHDLQNRQILNLPFVVLRSSSRHLSGCDSCPIGLDLTRRPIGFLFVVVHSAATPRHSSCPVATVHACASLLRRAFDSPDAGAAVQLGAGVKAVIDYLFGWIVSGFTACWFGHLARRSWACFRCRRPDRCGGRPDAAALLSPLVRDAPYQSDCLICQVCHCSVDYHIYRHFIKHFSAATGPPSKSSIIQSRPYHVNRDNSIYHYSAISLPSGW